MSIYEQWKELGQNAGEEFWKDYFNAEKDVYEQLLGEKDVVSGTFSELAERFGMELPIFAGFMDGINSSLKSEYDVEALEETSEVALDYDPEKLYFNMHMAKADWLYNLDAWETLLTAEQRHDITREYRRAGMAVSEKTVGRNDPCPCGSGKKYKKCCGAGK